jgi:hypothetical protein
VTVSFSGSGITVTHVQWYSNAELVVSVDVDCSAVPTARDVTVTNVDGGTVTAVGALTLLDPRPVLASITPTVMGQGAIEPVSLAGSGFVPTAALSFSGGDIFAQGGFSSPTQGGFNLWVSESAALTDRDAIVTSPPCGRQSILPSALRIVAGPKIASITPRAVRRGDADDTLVVTGTNFAADATVTFLDIGVTVTSVSRDSDSQLTVHIAVSADAPERAEALIVTNPDDGGAARAPFSVAATQLAVFRDGVWLVRHTYTTGIADFAEGFGDPGDQPVACGAAGPVIYRGGVFYSDPQSNGFARYTEALGNPGDIGLCRPGWRCSAQSFTCSPYPLVGVYRPSTAAFYLEEPGPDDGPVQLRQTFFGNPGDRPVIGDWDGSGNVTIGVVRDGTWYLANSDDATVADVTFGYGNTGDTPVVGDWTGTGADRPGVVRNSVWFTRNTATTGIADSTFTYGDTRDIPTGFVD